MSSATDELFAPPAYEWQRLSPRYLSLLRLTSLLGPPILLGIAAILIGFLTDRWWPGAILMGLAVVIVVLRLVLVQRAVRAWGYVEREDDLYITRGVLSRTLVAVPYGRMQLVEVASGPLERAFGVATVTLKTASPATGAVIPGLEPAEAARLRDRLTELGEARASGL